MAEPESYEYVTVAEIKTRLNPRRPDSDSADGAILADIHTVCAEINAHCGRVFTAYPDSDRFDAPPTALLPLDDWIVVDSITIGGTAVDPALWLPITRNSRAPYKQSTLFPHWGAVRLLTGTWADRITGDPRAAVTLIGTRGYSATLAPAVHTAALATVLRLRSADSQLWQDTGGGPGFPQTTSAGRLIAPDVARLLQRLVVGQEETPWLM